MLIGSGLLLLLVAGGGVIYAARAALAQVLYHQAKYGSARDNLASVLRRCEAAYDFYPRNYRFCIWAAEMAWYGRYDAGEEQFPVRVAAAGRWTDVGLGLNPRHGNLQWLKAQLLWDVSRDQAIEVWRSYVDWHFWSPHNHVSLARLYAMDGRFADAEMSLYWVKGSPYYRETVAFVDAERRRQLIPRPR